MKKNILALVTLSIFVIFAQSTFAQSKPQIEPGPVQTLSEDVIHISSILLNKQVKDCVTKLQFAGFEFRLSNVTFQALQPGMTRYIFSGMAIVGGDVAIGRAEMTVMAVEQKNPFGRSTTYNCFVKLPKRSF